MHALKFGTCVQKVNGRITGKGFLERSWEDLGDREENIKMEEMGNTAM